MLATRSAPVGLCNTFSNRANESTSVSFRGVEGIGIPFAFAMFARWVAASCGMIMM